MGTLQTDLREFRLFVRSDCSAARSPREHRQAIEHIREMADAKMMPAAKLRLDDLKGPGANPANLLRSFWRAAWG